MSVSGTNKAIAKDNDIRINKLMGELNAQHGKGKRQIAGYATDLKPETEFLLTGNLSIDVLNLNGRGVPYGSIVMPIGYECCGKSRFTKAALAAAQRQQPDKWVAAIPAEQGDYLMEALEEAGIDLSRLILVYGGEYAEKNLDYLMGLLWDDKTNTPRNVLAAWALDSIPALVTKAEIKGSLEDEAQQASHARLMHKFLRPAAVKQGDAVGYLVNQLRPGRPKYGEMTAPKPTWFGGRAPAQYSRVVLQFSKFGGQMSKDAKDWYENQGQSFQILVRTEKDNRFCGRLFAQSAFRVWTQPQKDHGVGIWDAAVVADLVRILGGFREQGSHYYFDHLPSGPVKVANGKDNIADGLVQLNLVDQLKQWTLDESWRRTEAGRQVGGNLVLDTTTGQIVDSNLVDAGVVAADVQSEFNGIAEALGDAMNEEPGADDEQVVEPKPSASATTLNDF